MSLAYSASPLWGMSDAQTWALAVVVVAAVAVAFTGVNYAINLLQSRQARAVEEATQALRVRLVQLDAAHAQYVLMCSQARDHVAVLGAFREGFQLFADDVEISEARALYAAATAAAAQRPATGDAHSPTEALPPVRRNVG